MESVLRRRYEELDFRPIKPAPESKPEKVAEDIFLKWVLPGGIFEREKVDSIGMKVIRVDD